MKTFQTVATSTLSFSSPEMPEAIREETLKSGDVPEEADPVPALSTRKATADGANWLLVNRTFRTGGEAPVSHTLAIREDDPSWMEPHLRSLLDELKHEYAGKVRNKSDGSEKEFEPVLAEFRREVIELRNRVNEYANAKWWHFEEEDEVRSRRQELAKLERAAKNTTQEELKEYRSKASPVIRLLTSTGVSAKDPSLADPHPFLDLHERFEKLSDEYRELSRIISICDRSNIAETSAGELSTSNARLTEELSGIKRELEVSKLSDKIMSSSMKSSSKEKARANIGKFDTVTWLTGALIILSITVAVLLVIVLTQG